MPLVDKNISLDLKPSSKIMAIDDCGTEAFHPGG